MNWGLLTKRHSEGDVVGAPDLVIGAPIRSSRRSAAVGTYCGKQSGARRLQAAPEAL